MVSTLEKRALLISRTSRVVLNVSLSVVNSSISITFHKRLTMFLIRATLSSTSPWNLLLNDLLNRAFLVLSYQSIALHRNSKTSVIHKVKVDSNILYDSFGGKDAIRVTLWHLDYNGKEVGRCSTTVDIQPFEGQRDIISLSLFPCEYHDNLDGGKTRDNLIEYGRKWYKYLSVDQMQYSGRLWDSGTREVSATLPTLEGNASF